MNTDLVINVSPPIQYGKILGLESWAKTISANQIAGIFRM